MKRITLILSTTLFAAALPLTVAAQHHHDMHASHETKAAQQDPIFKNYEDARQAMIKASIPDIQKSAKQIVVAAHNAGEHAIAEKAAALEETGDLAAARKAFSDLSDAVIKYRDTRCCAKPAVAYCSMEKKSWLQPAGEIGNPYVGASMRKCGEITKEAEDAK